MCAAIRVCRRCISVAEAVATPRLEVAELRAGYDAGDVVHDLSLRVAPGEAVALLGRNGAGKTTTLMTIAGAVACRGGRVLLDGRDVAGLPAHRVSQAGVALVPQGRRIFPHLTVHENLVLGRREDADLARVLTLFPILGERAQVAGSALSGGEQQMLAIGRALMTAPRLLLLDEPSEGLAPQVVRRIGELVGELRGHAGLSILVAEQNLALALAIADRVYVLDRGSVAHEERAAEFGEDRAAQRRLLGV
jgi:branched-chain amino acid transport system ATP-binding protein